jgi:hypothetical protein
MAPSWRGAVDALLGDLTRVFGPRLQSVVVYGAQAEHGSGDEPVNCLALVQSLSMQDLEACAGQTATWRRHGLATPLLLPADEFHRSLDAFPLEYGEIIRAHTVAFGSDPFEHATIAVADLRRACETQVKSHLVHLRESFLEAGGKPHAIAEVVTASAPAFAALLRNVARLHDAGGPDRAEATRDGARLAGLPEPIVSAILQLERRSAMASTDAARLFADYLAAVEQLAHSVDTWRA